MAAMINRWLLTMPVLLLAVLMVALGFPDSYAGAVTVYTFIFVGLFFGAFGLMWGGCVFDASAND
jgi:hypothetical protein